MSSPQGWSASRSDLTFELPTPSGSAWPRGSQRITPALADLPAPAASDAAPPAGASALDRAQHFAAYLARLSAAEWEDVLQRVHAVDAAAHAAAVHRVADVLDTHPQMRAIDALQRAVLAAAPPNTSAGRVATHAAFALALRDALSAREFAALYGPFARPEPSAFAAQPSAAGDDVHVEERRVAVDALAEVARPLEDG